MPLKSLKKIYVSKIDQTLCYYEDNTPKTKTVAVPLIIIGSILIIIILIIKYMNIHATKN